MSAETITRTCPDWCGDDEGHDWAHGSLVGIIGRLAVTRVLAHRADRDPISKLWPFEAVEIATEDEHGDTEQRIVCTPAEARSLAAALVRTADLIELVRGSA